jgi:hypothetical protein
MDNENLQQGFSESRKGAPVKYVNVEGRIVVDLRVAFWIKLEDAAIFKKSLEKWAAQWD